MVSFKTGDVCIMLSQPWRGAEAVMSKIGMGGGGEGRRGVWGRGEAWELRGLQPGH